MHRLSAALAGLAVIVTAGCGTAQATAPTHPAPRSCLSAGHGITQADRGKTYCVRVGDQVSVFLGSTQQDLWQAPQASGDALEAVPNGAGSLVVGATGAWYRATRPGRAVVTSARPPCRAAAVTSCAVRDRFTVTIIVR